MSLRTSLRTASALLLGISLFTVGSNSNNTSNNVSHCSECCATPAYACYSPGSRVPFRKEEFALQGSKWSQPAAGDPVVVTYSYSNLLDGSISGMNKEQLMAAVEEALSLWASVAPITFIEVPDSGPLPQGNLDASYDGKVAAHIRYGRHTIDGGGQVVAHAYYPSSSSVGLAGDVHFDSAENWSKLNGGLFLEACIHETGHALGLAHEGKQNAIMNPSLKKRFSGLGVGYLTPDDIAGIQTLYGAGVGSVISGGDVPSPVPVYPAGEIVEAKPVFQWEAVPGAASYQVLVEDSATGAIITQQTGITSINFTQPTNLTAGKTYDWYVKAVIDGGACGGWSEPLDFKVKNATAPASKPIPTSPIGFVDDTTPTFEWTAVSGVFTYQLKVVNAATGSVVVNVKNVSGNSYTHGTAFGRDVLYRWQVRTAVNGTFGAWSDVADFEIEASNEPAPITVPVPVSPIDFSDDLTPTFEWLPVPGVAMYHVKVVDVTSGKALLNVKNVVGNEITSTKSLTPGGQYSWQVRTAYPDGTFGKWSGVATFEIE